MKCRLFMILSALLLLLCVAVVMLWVRSYFVGDKFFWHFCEDEREYTLWVQDTVKVGRGGVGFFRVVQAGPRGTWQATVEEMKKPLVPFHTRSAADYPHFYFREQFGRTDGTRLGFKWGYREAKTGTRTWVRAHQVVIPFWAILLLLGPPVSVIVWRLIRRRHQKKVGLCPACGYDLRATPGRCPECGSVPGSVP